MNPYRYVGGNPESYNDPSGQYRIDLGGLTCAFSGCVESEIPIVNDNLGPRENPNPLGNDLQGPVINDSLKDTQFDIISDTDGLGTLRFNESALKDFILLLKRNRKNE